jgi:hypothetical protein
MQPSPKRFQPEPENKFPDCLYMKLEGIPVQSGSLEDFDVWQASIETPQIDLCVTLKFSEQWENLKGGRIKFGLRGGELRLKLENSEIPDEAHNLAGIVELSKNDAKPEPQSIVERKSLDSRLRAFNSAFKASSTEPSPEAEHPITLCHITTKVSEENPAWVFEEIGEIVLRGSLYQTKLATLNISALPCRVEATFEISKQDLCLTDAEGLWPPDISRNKQAVLERLMIQRLLEPNIKPYLSKAELHYD